MRLVVRLGLAALLAAAALTAPAAAQQPEDGISIRLVDAPAERHDDPRARLYVLDHVQPGAFLERQVAVVNHGDERTTVLLYPGGADVDDEGFAFRDRDANAGNELTGWTDVSPSSLTLAPGAEGVATVRVAVPTDATDAERYAVVWAELPATGTAGVRTVNRVGVRMYLSVGAGGEPDTDFDVTTLTPRRDPDGRPVIDADVVNTGGRALDIGGELQLSSDSATAGPFLANGGTTIGIGRHGTVTVPIDEDLAAGPWQARLVVRSGETEQVVEATLTFPDGAGATSAPVTAQPPDVAHSPFTLLASLLALAVLLALLWVLSRRDRETQLQPAMLRA